MSQTENDEIESPWLKIAQKPACEVKPLKVARRHPTPPPTAAAPAPQKTQRRQSQKKHGIKPRGSCNRCGDFGHVATDCRTKMCSFCKTRGHTRERCFSDPANCCSNCGTYGHEVEKCELCKRCGDFGHLAEECRTKICDDCGKRGHLAASCWFNKVCERCSLKGHIEQSCRTRLWCTICKEAHRKCADVDEESQQQ